MSSLALPTLRESIEDQGEIPFACSQGIRMVRHPVDEDIPTDPEE